MAFPRTGCFDSWIKCFCVLRMLLSQRRILVRVRIHVEWMIPRRNFRGKYCSRSSFLNANSFKQMQIRALNWKHQMGGGREGGEGFSKNNSRRKLGRRPAAALVKKILFRGLTVSRRCVLYLWTGLLCESEVFEAGRQAPEAQHVKGSKQDAKLSGGVPRGSWAEERHAKFPA